MSGKDVLKLLLCTFGYDRKVHITLTRTGDEEPHYDVYAENKDGDVYVFDSCEGLMFAIYNIISYMIGYDKFIRCPDERTRFLDLRNLKLESDWWQVPPKYIINDEEREKIVKNKMEE